MNCYESEKEQIVCEENELDEDLKEEFMRKKLDKFDYRKNLFKGKDLVKNDPNIEIEIIYQKKKNKYSSSLFFSFCSEESIIS